MSPRPSPELPSRRRLARLLFLAACGLAGCSPGEPAREGEYKGPQGIPGAKSIGTPKAKRR